MFGKGSYLDWVCKFQVKGPIWIRIIEFGAYYMMSIFGDGLVFVTLQYTQIHIKPPREHTHGSFKCSIRRQSIEDQSIECKEVMTKAKWCTKEQRGND